MCNASAVMQGIQTGLGVVGGAVSAAGNQAEGDYGSQVSERNAEIAGRASQDAYARGTQSEITSRLKWGQLAGNQTTALAGAGVDLQSKTALDLLADTNMMSEHDARVIQNNAAREAWGYQAQAANFRAQGKMAKVRADYNETGSLLGMASGGAAGISQTVDQAKKG